MHFSYDFWTKECCFSKRESQNHRMVGDRRNFWKPSGPTACSGSSPRAGCLGSCPGDFWRSPKRSLQCLSPSQYRRLSLCLDGTLCALFHACYLYYCCYLLSVALIVAVLLSTLSLYVIWFAKALHGVFVCCRVCNAPELIRAVVAIWMSNSPIVITQLPKS